MASFNIKTKQDLVAIKNELMNRKLSDKIDEQKFQESIYKMNEPTINPINEMKNQIVEGNVILKAIKNMPNQNQPELARIEGLVVDPAVTIGPIASHFLSKVYQKDYNQAYGVQ